MPNTQVFHYKNSSFLHDDDFRKVMTCIREYTAQYGLSIDFESLRHNNVLIAQTPNGQFQGFMTYFEAPFMFTDNKVLFLNFIFVERKFRGQGVGAALRSYLSKNYTNHNVLRRVLKKNKLHDAYLQSGSIVDYCQEYECTFFEEKPF